ncbi:hypothetical protein GGS21DRAFT_510655 [Xylaria nigripes]|nr:hypothetical protein GGS21DRAFT_510655 [Xylaria nigripes]
MMTISNPNDVGTKSTAVLATVESVDILARQLYRRARNAGPDFEDVASVVRDLYTVLKHLKVEAGDPESLLTSDKSGAHIRQLTPIVKDTEVTLGQLDTILESYFNCGAGGTGTGGNGERNGERNTIMSDRDRGWTILDTMGPGKIELICDKLDYERLKIDMFLNTIQPHNPSKSRQRIATTETGFEDISFFPGYPALKELSEEYLVSHDIDNEKLFPSTEMERLELFDHPTQPSTLPSRGAAPQYDHSFSNKPNKPSSDFTAFISTRELIEAKDMLNLSRSMESWQLGPSPLHWSPATFGSQTSPILRLSSDTSPQDTPQEPVNQKAARLGPDSQGREIPLDAIWTRINRRLVSPEVLQREGFRYEAKPDFVAILGELKREEVADLARKSSEVRDQRQRATSQSRYGGEQRPMDRRYPDKSRNWRDMEDQQDRNEGRGYVINSPHHHGANSTASSTGKLWDSSDDESCKDIYENRPSATRYSSSYPPRSRSRPSSYHRHSSSSSRASNELVSHNNDDKGTKSYPFIVPPPGKEGDSHGKTSPSATVKPKSILKNKNDNPHVRFDPEPQVLHDSANSATQSGNQRDRGKETNDREYRDRDRDKVQVHDRERERRYRSDAGVSRERHRDRSRHHERDYRHDNRSHGDRKYYIYSSGHDDRHYHSRRSREYRDRERDRERDRDRSRDRDHGTRRKSRGETFRVGGIGGAAAGLMSILTEAAAGL